jgi:hypothetical protein
VEKPYVLLKSEATTDIRIKIKYNMYDLNRDGVVDLLDLAIVLVHVGYDLNHLDWFGPGYILVDAHNVPIHAVMCDVAPLNAPNGVIDMADVLEVYINYT